MSTPDEKHKIWADAYKEMQKHSEPSPETRERLACLEANQNNFMVELQEIKKMIGELRCDVKEALNNKADKKDVDAIWLLIKWLGLTIGGGIAAFLTWLLSTGTIHLTK